MDRYHREHDVSAALKSRLAALNLDHVKAEVVEMDMGDGPLEVLYITISGSMGHSLLAAMSDAEIVAALKDAVGFHDTPLEVDIGRGAQARDWKAPFNASDVVANVDFAGGEGTFTSMLKSNPRRRRH
jgi:hypothetical protein